MSRQAPRHGRGLLLALGAAGVRLRRALRVSRFELRIAAALVVAATLPFVGALLLADRVAAENQALGVNPRVVERLRSVPGLYGDLFQARKQLYAEQARELARRLPARPVAARAFVEGELARNPRLRHVTWTGRRGEVLLDTDSTTPAPGPELQWREAPPIRVELPDGSQLTCVFAIEAQYFVELAEARDLAETVQNVAALRPEIRRSYVLSFGALLVVWAIAAAVIGIALARRTTRRVTALVGGVRRLAAGDLAVQVDPGGFSDEVAGLTRAFNQMVREVRESRDRIVYLEKISGWQDVARRLAHEIKNPLTPMKLAFQQLQVRWDQVREKEPAFGKLLADVGEIMRDEIGTLQRLVDEFSGFAKLPDVRPEPADLGDFVEEFVGQNPQITADADVEVVRAAGVCPVELDRALMRRVLANLCSNGIEASRPARPHLHLGVARTRDRAVLTVADEGPGVDPELRERIFDPYFTTKTGTGTGLGLAIVKKIVLQHGGEIQVGSRPGGGASFTIAFPLRVEKPGSGTGTGTGSGSGSDTGRGTGTKRGDG